MIKIVLLRILALSITDGAKSATRKICLSNGVTYRPGDKFQEDCKTCTCTKKGIVCTKKAFQCGHNGAVIQPGETFKIGCNDCFCTEKGISMCAMMLCIPSDFELDY